MLSVNWPRMVVGLVVPAALAVAGGGSALAASGAAAAAVHGSAGPACTVSWVGLASRPLWTIGKNWSTGTVPGPSSDVCITTTGDDVLTPISISVHSLLLGKEQGIALEGTAAKPLTATVATSVTLTPGEISRIDLTDASISAAQINDQGGTIFTDGPCTLTSPDIAFGAGGSVQAANGTTTLTSLPQLSDGTLTGATIDTSNATVVLPGDITSLVAANIGVGADSEIQDQAGHNALTGLTSIDSQSSLSVDSDLTLTGSLTADGNVSLGAPALSVAGSYTQAQGTLSLSGPTILSTSQVQIDQGASLQANQGTIEANLVNDGSVAAIGFAATRVTGTYTQAPGGSLSSGFAGPLAVTGEASLAGSVSTVDAFPTPGASSPVITFGSLAGDFTRHSLGFRLVTKAHQIDAVITPQIAASPATVAPGHTVTVSGVSFTLGSTVTLFLDHASGTALGSAQAGYGGRFTVTVVIPASTTPGSHELIAVGSDGSRAETAITVS